MITHKTRSNRLDRIPVFAIFLLAACTAMAQHCPYDGYYLIVVHATDSAGQPVTSAQLKLYVSEVENASGRKGKQHLLTKEFLPVKLLLIDSLNLLPGKDVLEQFCSKCSFLGAGYYAVKLEQRERHSPPGDSKDQLTKVRLFEVCNGNEKTTIPLPQVYRLCWSEGRWDRIQPVEISIKKDKQLP